MQRYFIPKQNWQNNKITITDDDAHHMIRVMRNRIGDVIVCNHPDGKRAKCKISAIEGDTVIANVVKWLEDSSELPIKVTIAQAIPKGDKIELVLQKGTELGASGFIPYQAERTVVRWDEKKSNKKLQRFKKIVKEASEQSRRNFIPFVHEPAGIDHLIAESKNYEAKIFAYEEEAKVESYHSLADELKQLKQNDRLLVCIGPEGGFSDEEAHVLNSTGFIPVRLGPRILRTETASLYLLSSISYHFEELRC